MARPGHTFLSRDFSGIEAVLVGYFAKSARYIRLAKIDIHSYYMAYALNQLDGRVISSDLPDINWSDDRLIPHLAWLKKTFREDRNNLYKHLVHGCVTGDHEVLTPHGWVRFDQLENDALVAQWSKGGFLEFVAPTQVVRQYWSGDIVKWRGQAISLNMTPDHRVPITNSYGSLSVRLAAEVIPDWAKTPSTGVLDGTIELCKELIQLLVAIQADSTLYGNHVTFHLVRPRKITRLLGILGNLRIQYSYADCRCHDTGVRISFNMKHLGLQDYLNPDKTFCLESILQLTAECKQHFLEELPYWDGTRGGRSGKQTSYLSTIKQNVDLVQTVAHVTGRRSLVSDHGPGGYGTKPVYCASLANRKLVSLSQVQKSTESFNGAVYCVSVPSGFFLVRHEGKIVVTGNSNFKQGAIGAKEKILLETGIDYPVGLVGKVMRIYFELFPEIPKWHSEVLLQVEKDGFIRNPFGYIQRFNRVFEYENVGGVWRKEPGPEASKVIASGPQSTAAGIITEAMLRLYQERFEEAGQYLRLLVHDELLSEVPDDQLDEVDAIMKEEMEKPIPELLLPESYGMGPYLNILTEGKRGKRWGSMS